MNHSKVALSNRNEKEVNLSRKKERHQELEDRRIIRYFNLLPVSKVDFQYIKT